MRARARGPLCCRARPIDRAAAPIDRSDAICKQCCGAVPEPGGGQGHASSPGAGGLLFLCCAHRAVAALRPTRRRLLPLPNGCSPPRCTRRPAAQHRPEANFWLQFVASDPVQPVRVDPAHILSHHQYTNDPQHDVDVHHFAGARLARSQPRYSARASGSCFNEGWTFAWKGCLTTLGTCILQPLRTLLEKPTPHFDVNLTPVPAAVSKRALLVSMLPSFFVLLYPILSLACGAAASVAPAAIAFAQVWPWVGMSIIWTLMTQTSHVQADCQPELATERGEPHCWTARQIATALDYSVGRRVATALTAGLNNQGLHHAMPAISMAHFPDMTAMRADLRATGRAAPDRRPRRRRADVRPRLRPQHPANEADEGAAERAKQVHQHSENHAEPMCA